MRSRNKLGIFNFELEVYSTLPKDPVVKRTEFSCTNISVVSTVDCVRHHFGVQQLIVNITLPAHGWIVRFLEERRVQNLVRKKSDYV